MQHAFSSQIITRISKYNTNMLFFISLQIHSGFDTIIHISHGNTSTEERSKAGNNFRLFLEKYLRTLNIGSYEDFYSELLADAQTKELIINNII